MFIDHDDGILIAVIMFAPPEGHKPEPPVKHASTHVARPDFQGHAYSSPECCPGEQVFHEKCAHPPALAGPVHGQGGKMSLVQNDPDTGITYQPPMNGSNKITCKLIAEDFSLESPSLPGEHKDRFLNMHDRVQVRYFHGSDLDIMNIKFKTAHDANLSYVSFSRLLRSASGTRKYSGRRSRNEYCPGEAPSFRAAHVATDEALFSANAEGMAV